MNHYHPLLVPFAVLLFLFYLLTHPGEALLGSRDGLLLWFETLLPTLLPYMIVSNFLLATDLIPRLLKPIHPLLFKVFGLSVYGSYGLFLGLLCGYPMGAKAAADLYTSGKINMEEARYLLAISNGPSPAFLMNYILGENLKLGEQTGTILLLYYGSLLICALLLRRLMDPSGKTSPKNPSDFILMKKETSHSLSLGEKIDVSVMNGFETITKLGGYIILCSIAAGALKSLPGTLRLPGLLIGILTEITTGIHTICMLPLNQTGKLIASLTTASFGGLCILMQTQSVIHHSRLPLSSYLKGKLLQSGMLLILLLLFR